MKIIYVHHGHRKNLSNKNDDLTKLGYKDCKLMAKLFNNKEVKTNLKAIYASPIFRCVKTAEILNKYLKTKIITDERLNEKGSFENESWIDVQKRVIDCIEDIIAKFNDEDIVICVTSGVNLGAFVCKSFNLIPSNNTPFLGVPSCSPVIFEFKKQN